jgi:hypothetical protein
VPAVARQEFILVHADGLATGFLIAFESIARPSNAGRFSEDLVNFQRRLMAQGNREKCCDG